MSYCLDNEVKNISLSLLDFFQKSVVGNLRQYITISSRRVSTESPLIDIVSYSYTVRLVVENLLNCRGKDTYTAIKDLIIVDRILSVLWKFYRLTLEESETNTANNKKEISNKIRNQTLALSMQLVAKHPDLSFADKVVEETSSKFINKSEKYFYLVSLGCHIFDTLNQISDFRRLAQDNDKIIRTIEFPEEYLQSGISLLNYFGTVLRKKHPANQAKVKIEQQGLNVSLIIENLGGESEVIEKSLKEYGLVLSGEMAPDVYANDKLFALELKNELRLAHARIQHLEELLEYKKTTENNLFKLLDNSINTQKEVNVDLNISPTISSTTYSEISISPILSQIEKDLDNLVIENHQNQSEIDEISKIKKEFQNISNSYDKKEISKSSALKALKNYLDSFHKCGKKIDAAIHTGKNTINTIRKLIKYYNQVADYCGLPRVPSIIVKE